MPPQPDDFTAELGTFTHDRRDPDQWWALYTDRSLPLDPQVKAALVLDARSFSRRVLLPLLRPLARTLLVLVGLFRILVPRALTSSALLHRLIYVGLRYFVSPQANFLILRHFHLGSNVVAFLAANSGTSVSTHPLRPLAPADVKQHLFLQHDLNLYNFIISLNAELAAAGRDLAPPARIDFDAIDERPIPFAPFPRGPFNFIDSVSAIELYTPLYHLLLGQRDFARANQSLQLDETVGIYAAQVLGDPTHLALVNNHHPWVPLSSIRAGYRLVLHGLGTEMLHAVLVQHKRAAAGGAQPAGTSSYGLQSLWRGQTGRVTALADIHIDVGRLPLALVFAITAAGFLLIYFGVGALAHLLTTRVFPRLGVGRRIADRALAPGQTAREIRQSLVSIAIFGGYGVLTAVGVRAGLWAVVPLRSPGGVALEIAFLVLWNDVHFYAVHRLLHGRWLFQHIHREHHRAIRPTPFSTYAMHPVEALLLGSVMVLVQPFHAFSLPTLLLFPLVSLAMNNLGHMNYDLVPRLGVWHPLAATRRHERHHRHVTGNYGFLLPVLDRWLGTEIADEPTSPR